MSSSIKAAPVRLAQRLLRPLLLGALLASASAAAALPPSMARLLDKAGIPQEAVGVMVLRGNEVLLAHGAERSMNPASTMKLVTTLVGLEQLGPAFRGRTELRTSAEQVGGLLKGDLVLRGWADADFSAAVLEQMLQTLRYQGIHTIGGDLIADRQLFQPARPDLAQGPFDTGPEWRYNVVPDALLLNTNLLQIDMSSNARLMTVQMLPLLEGVSISSDMRLIEANCAKWEDGWRAPEYQRDGNKLRILLHGTFPKNCSRSTSINVLERQDYLDRLFRATWSRLGGSFSGSVREGSSGVEGRLLADHVARALPEIVRDTNKNSDNTLARTIYLSLGSLEYDAWYGSRPTVFAAPGTTVGRAELAVRLWFQRHRIDDLGLVLENGSGLSRIERMRPSQLAAVLQAGRDSQWAPEFLSSLPIAALDGTMRKRLADSPAASRARLKTGSLSGVVALAGYVPDANNQQCIVVGFVNHELAGNGNGRAVLDALVDWVASSPLPFVQPAL